MKKASVQIDVNSGPPFDASCLNAAVSGGIIRSGDMTTGAALSNAASQIEQATAASLMTSSAHHHAASSNSS